MIKNIKTCIICKKTFPCPPSSKKVTCSKKCQKIYAKQRGSGRKFSEETKRKLSEKAKQRDMMNLQIQGTEAAKLSPNSGRFETNVNAKEWHLISPDGKHYEFQSLNFWLRENGEELFNCKPDSREYSNVRAGLAGAKRAILGGNYNSCTYKGWQVIPTKDDI